MYSDNAGVVLSVETLACHQQTRDHRFSADARVGISRLSGAHYGARKRQLHRKFVDYYSRIRSNYYSRRFGFARIKVWLRSN